MHDTEPIPCRFVWSDAPFGTLTLTDCNGYLTAIQWGTRSGATEMATPLLWETVCQLSAYFKGRLQRFDLPLAPAGTPFQQQVWRALQEIPYGETVTYADIAVRIGRPLAVRAVGMANHRNPLPIVVPCHRVIGKNGSLTGYAGGLELKSSLLNMEAAFSGKIFFFPG